MEAIVAPKARSGESLNITRVGDELVVYDLVQFKAHRLNPTAAAVFEACDGTRSVADLAALLGTQSTTHVDTEVVWYALNELHSAQLLETALPARQFLTRRQLVAAAGAAAMVVLPVIASIVVPTPAEAQSGGFQSSASSSG